MNRILMKESVNTMLGVFLKAVESVKPANLIQNNLSYDKHKDTLHIFNDEYDLKDRNVFLVGAGKAVLQMANEMENILETRLKQGIVSVPHGISKLYPCNYIGSIQCYEGAENNVADKKSESATLKIINLVKSLDEKSLLLVLLSGGGSALLPSPLPPITLKEKSDLIKELAKAGADIVELNTVRKKISSIKGGKLSQLAHPAEVIALLLVDIVGNNCEYVASGPTFQNNDKPSDAAAVIEKYAMKKKIPQSIENILYLPEQSSLPPFKSVVSNYVLGNNTVAIAIAYDEATRAGYKSFNLTDNAHGDVETLSLEYCLLVTTVVKLLSNSLTKDAAKSLLMTLTNISPIETIIEELVEINLNKSAKGICLVAGGEPTVKVVGGGKGGRSQQLALSFSQNYHLEMQKDVTLNTHDVFMLCAGTDGIDGPTDAAGAVGYSRLVSDATVQNLDVNEYVFNNDSYTFYEKFSNGEFHIKTGHTNTNVMDIHIILIKTN